MTKRMDTRKLVMLAMLAAISVALVMTVHIPMPFAPFLEYDPADIPIFIATFAFGPVSGLVVTVVVSVIQACTVSSLSGWIGALMHVIATGSFVLVAGILYKKFHTIKGAILSLGAGALTMVLMMIPLNLIFTPLFMGAPVSVVRDMLLPAIIPFNLIKAGGNALLTFFLYKAIHKVILRFVSGSHSRIPVEDQR